MDKNGLKYLGDEPYGVYEKLVKSGVADKKIAGAILYFLINGLHTLVRRDSKLETFSKTIKSQCSFNKAMADTLASIFLSLYSQNNRKEWRSKKLQGLGQFMNEGMACHWDGSSVWEDGNVEMNCSYEADIELIATEDFVPDGELAKMLLKNPFMTKEEISDYYDTLLTDYLDGVFDEYCNGDDYYPPVVEDFELRYYVEDWCKKYGLDIVSCEGDGSDNGYEPREGSGYRRWRY